MTLSLAVATLGFSLPPSAATLVPTAGETATHDEPSPTAAIDRVEVPSRATEMSNTFRSADGSFTTELYGAPVNYEDAEGDWKPIESDLVPAPGAAYAVENEANSFTAQVPQDASETPVKFGVDDRWVTMRMRGLDGAPLVEKSTATFSDVDGADEVSYEVAPHGLKESITLDNAPDAAAVPLVYSYDLAASAGLTPRVTPEGSIAFADGAGKVYMRIPVGVMFDSATPEAAASDKVDFKLEAAGSGWTLTVIPDMEWLRDSARVYPVVIDPTLTTDYVVHDCWIDQALPTTNYCGNQTVKVGRGSSSMASARRGFVNFPVDQLLQQLPANATVTGASVRLYNLSSQSATSNTADYKAWRVTSNWSDSATWNNRGIGLPWSTPGGDYDNINYDDTLAIQGTGSGYRYFDAQNIVQDWVGGSPNYGVMVRQVYPENIVNTIAFVSMEDLSNQDKWPQLSVTYTETNAASYPGAGDRDYFTYATEKLDDKLTAKANVANGNLLVTGKDLNVAGVAGLDMAFTRYYNSSLPTTGPVPDTHMGTGWSDNLGGSVRLEFPSSGRVLFYGPSGFRVRFDKSVTGDSVKYIRAAPGMNGTLKRDSSTGNYTLTGYDKSVYQFDGNGKLLETRDKQGNKLTMTYYLAGNSDGAPAGALKQVDDTRGRVMVFSYDATNQVLNSVEVRNSGGTPLIRYAYTYAGSPQRLMTSRVDYVDPSLLQGGADATNMDAVTSYSYDSNGRMSQIVDPRDEGSATDGGTTQFDYDSSGRISTLRRVLDSALSEDQANTTTYTKTETTFTYTTGKTSLPTDCNESANDDIVNSTLVDGERTDVTDTTRYCSDTNDRVRRTIDAKGHVRKNTFTGNSNVATYDGSGLAAGGSSSFSFTYDGNDNPTQATTPTGGKTSAQYGDTTNPNFPTSTRDFDTGGSTSQPATWSYDYDDKGNLIEAKAAVTSGKNITYRYCWDGDGQLQRIDPIDSAGANSVSLDESSTSGCGTANQGNDTLFTYNGQKELWVVDPPGSNRTQSYTYDALSRVKTVTDGRGVVTTYGYDALDHVVSQTFAGTTTQTVTWDYDEDGNMTKLTDGSTSSPTSFAYDELNRTAEESATAPASTKAYFYDAADNVREVAVSDEPEPTKYTYDKVNLVISVDDQRSGVNKITFDYDRHDKRTKTTFPMPGTADDIIQFAVYGDGGQLKCIYSWRETSVPTGAGDEDVCPSSTASGLLTFYGYSYKNGSTDTNTRYKTTEKGGVATSYTYDPISRLTGASTKAGDATTTLRSFTYDYDRHSNLTKDVTTGPPATGSAAPQLPAGATTTTFGYNDAEELCWSYTGTSTNACGSAPTGAKTYTYDGAGALTGATGGLVMQYNNIGQTTSVTPSSTASALTMQYQGVTQDRRVQKGTTEMSYGFSGLSSQGTNSGQPHAQYFVRDPSGKLLATVNRDSSWADRYYLTDAQDSVIATIDTTGEVWRYLYEPYGEQIRTWQDTTPYANSSSSANPPDGSRTTAGYTERTGDNNPWRYASGYIDTETGMLKFGTRFYQPTVSRWTQTDPKAGKPREPLSMNPYLYAGQDPVNKTDPSGRDFGDFLDAITPDPGKIAGGLAGWGVGLGLVQSPLLEGTLLVIFPEAAPIVVGVSIAIGVAVGGTEGDDIMGAFGDALG